MGKRSLTRVSLLALILCLAVVSVAGASSLYFKISGEMCDLCDVSDLPLDAGYVLTGDGKFVIFMADRNIDDVFEIFSYELATRQVVQVNSPHLQSTLSTIIDFKVSPDGKWLVYISDHELDEYFEIYSVPITGQATDSRKLNEVLGEGDVKDFIITPDSQEVIFSTTNNKGDTKKLFFQKIDDSTTPVSMVGDLINVLIYDYDVSDDSRWVVFKAQLNADAPPDLYRFDLNAASSMVDLATNIDSFKIAPNAYQNQRVVYAIGEQLFSVMLDGSATTSLWSTPSDLKTYTTTPNGVYTVFSAILTADSTRILRAIPTAGGGYYEIANLPDGTTIGTYGFTPDSERIVYLADHDGDEHRDLFSDRPTTGDLVMVNGALVSGGDVFSFAISPDGQRIIYRADQEVDFKYELFSTTHAGDWVKLSPAVIPSNSDVDLFAITPDSKSVVYRSDHNTPTLDELFSVPIAGGLSTQVSGALVAGGDVKSFKISADSKKVVYLADQETDEKLELFMTVEMSGFYLPVVMK